jgi:adenosine kinase
VLDLVVVAPDDPTAMLEHSQECRDTGTPFAADPSQQLAFMDGASIQRLVDGATWLFSNEYEAGLIHEKTGWSPDEVLDRVGTRVTTHGAGGVLVERRGEDPVRVGIVPAREVAEPTGVGDAFRAGFLAATAWGLGLERACQVGALLATLVVETVGTQEYAYSSDVFASRLAEAYGEDAAAEVRPHLP